MTQPPEGLASLKLLALMVMARFDAERFVVKVTVVPLVEPDKRMAPSNENDESATALAHVPATELE